MEELYPIRNILCIDLKSFFAACECVDRGINPFTTALVVADPNRGNGAITLAITPYLKSLGIKSRGRIYEIPKNIKYQIAKPRMSLYIQKSKEVTEVYLDYVAKEDMHIYSIDEVFLDVTNYLKLYKKTDYELAEEILKSIESRTGLTATCGIGPNLLLAKLAMDIEAKKYKNGIAKWSYDDIKIKLWPVSPLSKIWGIGPKMEQKLNNIGLKNVFDIAHYPKNELKKKFGVLGEELWEHANGIDLSIISDWAVQPKEKSINHSQVLFKDYYENNIKIIIEEMVEVLLKRLRSMQSQTTLLGFGIGYSKAVGDGFYHSMKLDNPTDSNKLLIDYCFKIFDRYYNGSPIRKVSISFGRLTEKNSIQLNIFDKPEIQEKYDNINFTIDDIHKKHGKNSLFKATGLLPDSTIIERNKKTGGHSS